MTTPVVTVGNSWSKVENGPYSAGNCLAIAAIRDVFTMIRSQGELEPFLHVTFSGVDRRLGRTKPQILAMTAFDGKLFGVGNDDTIYCREATRVDLVWSPICAAPVPGGMTHSLAAYYGRL